jgi:hypothetical protein
VLGQLTGEPDDQRAPLVRHGAQRPRARLVQPRPLPGQQIVVHGLLHQGVPEVVQFLAGLVRGTDLEQPAVDRLPQRADQLVVGPAQDGRQKMVTDPPRRQHHRHCRQQPLRGRGQPAHPAQQHVPQRPRQPVRAGADPRGEELLGEERVALRPVEHLDDHPAAHRATTQSDQQLGQLGRVNRASSSQPTSRERRASASHASSRSPGSSSRYVPTSSSRCRRSPRGW